MESYTGGGRSERRKTVKNILIGKMIGKEEKKRRKEGKNELIMEWKERGRKSKFDERKQTWKKSRVLEGKSEREKRWRKLS